MLVQDEGLDIVIDTLDFADVTTDVNTTKFVATSFDQGQATPGSAIEFMTLHIQPLLLIVSELVELLHFIHHNHFQLYQLTLMVVYLNRQQLLHL